MAKDSRSEARPQGVSRARALLCVARCLLGAPACGRFRKAKECDLLAKAVSGWIKKQPPPDPASATPASLVAETRSLAKSYEALDHELGSLDIRSVELRARVARYREIATRSARALSDVARALESNDAELARRRRVEFGAMAASEAPLVAEINAECGR
jgi:hypothetical protein